MAKSLLEGFGEFYPFSFGEKKDDQVINVAARMQDEHPKSIDVIAELEEALVNADKVHSFVAVCICSDVLLTQPKGTSDASQIQFSEKGKEPTNLFVPYRRDENDKVDFLPHYKEEGDWNFWVE